MGFTHLRINKKILRQSVNSAISKQQSFNILHFDKMHTLIYHTIKLINIIQIKFRLFIITVLSHIYLQVFIAIHVYHMQIKQAEHAWIRVNHKPPSRGFFLAICADKVLIMMMRWLCSVRFCLQILILFQFLEKLQTTQVGLHLPISPNDQQVVRGARHQASLAKVHKHLHSSRMTN